jgi:hypothetical protein
MRSRTGIARARKRGEGEIASPGKFRRGRTAVPQDPAPRWCRAGRLDANPAARHLSSSYASDRACALRLRHLEPVREREEPPPGDPYRLADGRGRSLDRRAREGPQLRIGRSGRPSRSCRPIRPPLRFRPVGQKPGDPTSRAGRDRLSLRRRPPAHRTGNRARVRHPLDRPRPCLRPRTRLRGPGSRVGFEGAAGSPA